MAAAHRRFALFCLWRFAMTVFRPRSPVDARASALPQPLDFLRAANHYIEVVHQTVCKGIDPTVHAEGLTASPGVLHKHIGCDVPHLPNDVELAQAIVAGALISYRVKFVAMFVADLADGMQPMVDKAATFAVDRRAHASASIMSDHQNVLHLQHIDGELKDREIVRVLGGARFATFRCTKSSPGSSPTISFAGTRLSEQPIHRY